MLPSLECEAQEMPQEFARRVQYTLAREMGIQGSEVTQEDVKKWLAGNVGMCTTLLCTAFKYVK